MRLTWGFVDFYAISGHYYLTVQQNSNPLDEDEPIQNKDIARLVEIRSYLTKQMGHIKDSHWHPDEVPLRVSC